MALETSREVAVLDAQGRYEIFRFSVGRAPQGLAVSDDGKRLYVNNFMDRTVGVFDLTRLVELGESNVTQVATLSAVAAESLTAQVLKGKQFFYDARDTRLARDAYMSCASCHNDGDGDGRTWDLTGMGEGLRNTVHLRGRAGAQGFLHWSGNFDEVQDFEGQIRALAGGTGLMSDAEFNTGTRSIDARRCQGGRERGPGCARRIRRFAVDLREQPVPQCGRFAHGGGGGGSRGVPRVELRAMSRWHVVHRQRGREPAECRHYQARQWQSPRRTADRHRRADAARRVGDGALPARRLGADDRGRGRRAYRCQSERHRPRQPRRVRRADRRPGNHSAAA